MAGMDSSDWPAGGAAAANSGIGSLGGGVYLRARFVISSGDCTYGRLRRGQDEDEDHLWEAEVHKFMILPERIGGNASADCFRLNDQVAQIGHERDNRLCNLE